MSTLLYKISTATNINEALFSEWFFAPIQEIADLKLKAAKESAERFNHSPGAPSWPWRIASMTVYDEAEQANLKLDDLKDMPVSMLAVLIAKFATPKPVHTPIDIVALHQIDFRDVLAVGTLIEEDRISYYRVQMKNGEERTIYEMAPSARSSVPTMKREDFMTALAAAHNPLR